MADAIQKGYQIMKFDVDEKLIEPIIRDQIATAVISQLGNTDELVRRMVSLALSSKVNQDGVKGQYSSDNKYDFVEAVAGKTIRDAAAKAIQEIVAEQQPKITAAVKAELSKRPQKTAAAIVDAFVNSSNAPYKIKANFFFET